MPKIDDDTTNELVWLVVPENEFGGGVSGKLFYNETVVGELFILEPAIKEVVPHLKQLGLVFDVANASFHPDQHKVDKFNEHLKPKKKGKK